MFRRRTDPGAPVRATMMTLLVLLAAPWASAASPPPLPEEVQDLLDLLVPTIIPDTTVLPAEERKYEDRDYIVVGTIQVSQGGTLVLDEASFEVAGSSSGIVVQPGGKIRMSAATFGSTVGANAAPGTFAIHLMPGSEAEITDAVVRGGAGILVETEDALIERVVFERNSVGLRLLNVSVTIADNTFIDNDVGVNQTGGAPRLTRNEILGGTWCIRDWLTDPVIDNNTLGGCHFGIWHERSASKFEFNDIEDAFDPGGIGIALVDQVPLLQAAPDDGPSMASGGSTIVRHNTISRFGIGILVVNSAADIHNNTIDQSVFDGIRVENTTATVAIHRNTIHHNNDTGIRIYASDDAPVANNTVHNNTFAGIVLAGSPGALAADNLVENNTKFGVLVLGGDDATLARNTARENGVGIRLEADAPGALLVDNDVVSSTGAGIDVRADGADLVGNDVTASGDAGVKIASGGVDVSGGTLLQNGIGLEADGADDLTVTGTTIRLSVGDGVHYHDSDDATFDGVNASANGGQGFHVVAASGDVVTLTCVRAIANAQSGVFADGAATIDIADAWLEDSGAFGVLWAGAGSIDATASYWGTASGPTHSGNPGGTGDAVSDGVNYSGFLAAPPTC